MIGETGFTLLIFGIWLSALTFGSLVVYWFVRQGFSEAGIETGTQFPPEPWSDVKKSMLIWAGFFGLLVLIILLGG